MCPLAGAVVNIYLIFEGDGLFYDYCVDYTLINKTFNRELLMV